MQKRRAEQSRRTFLTSIAAAGATAEERAHGEDSDWPDRPVRIIVPYPAGGSTDVLMRILAERLKDMFAQSFVVENRGGAGGNIGIAAVTSSPPDGYTIGAATIGHFAINQFLYSKMPYDPERDMISGFPDLGITKRLCRSTDYVPAKTLSEFLTWAEQRGMMASVVPVSAPRPHLSGVMFSKRTGIDAIHVRSRGAAQTIPPCSLATSILPSIILPLMCPSYSREKCARSR